MDSGYSSVLKVEAGAKPRQLKPQWNHGLIVASIAISLLGAFTSTQLMCQARTARHFSGILVWTMLGSLTFGFCSIWSLHEVAMLACELDLPIGVDVPLTILSSILAVIFTFFALASDMLWDKYGVRQGKRSARKRKGSQVKSGNLLSTAERQEESSEPLLRQPQEEEEGDRRANRADVEPATSSHLSSKQKLSVNGDVNRRINDVDQIETVSAMQPPPLDPAQPSLDLIFHHEMFAERPTLQMIQSAKPRTENIAAEDLESLDCIGTESYQGTESDFTGSRRSSSFGESNSGSFGLRSIMSMKTYRKSTMASANAFVGTGMALYTGCNVRNILKGFFWSLAITSMHYVGIWGLRVPQGYIILNPLLVILSGLICWVVCVIGCILIFQIETHLGQQILFSVVATAGVAAMHFTGMRAATFWSYLPPSEINGYPPGLATAIASIAITTCIAANGLLAHSATLSRNKLAEVVMTRRKLWMAIAQKENAETAAAARSDFIASASHEIRTPLHHLQGYSDLLSRTELTEEGRLLLYAIQRATKTLSLITNNVLDWSRLEKDGEAVCRPVALDIRTVCESIVTLLPNQDDEVDVDLMVVVTPEVPHSFFLDETYIHRILMNLLSNALKFTSTGYIMLLIEMEGDKLVASVTDTGCGVPPSFLPQLFEPFKQAQTRGRQRGTGLGLSIIKQLLAKMQGTINVESRYLDAEDVGPEESGSTFTITLPVQSSTPPDPALELAESRSKITIFHAGNDRSLDGLRIAWEKFNFEVVVAKQFSDISGSDMKYIWADLPSLKRSPALLHLILKQDKYVVLVPYDMQSTLYEIPGLLQAPQHLIPIQKPLMWHSIMKRIVAAENQPTKTNLPRTVRFDPVVSVLDEMEGGENWRENLNRQQSFAEEESEQEVAEKATAPKQMTVLLVEDNPINCKLGKKMLQSLGYQVLIAEDGVEAIEQIVKHDAVVDAILMDQSMPRKDGLTATREIRAMEAAGTLSRRRPIIAVTAVVSAQAQTLCRLAGTDYFLAKPLSLGRLEETLSKHLHLDAKSP